MTFDHINIIPTVANFIVVTLMAVVGINVGKFLFARWKVPGLADLFTNA